MRWRSFTRSLAALLLFAIPASAQTTFSHSAGASGWIDYISNTGIRVGFWDFTSTTVDPARRLGVGGCAEVAFLLDQDISGADVAANVGVYSCPTAKSLIDACTLVGTITTEETLTYQIVGGYLGVTVAVDPTGGVTSRLQAMCHQDVSPQTCTSAGGPTTYYRVELGKVVGTPADCPANLVCVVNDDGVFKIVIGSTISTVTVVPD